MEHESMWSYVRDVTIYLLKCHYLLTRMTDEDISKNIRDPHMVHIDLDLMARPSGNTFSWFHKRKQASSKYNIYAIKYVHNGSVI